MWQAALVLRLFLLALLAVLAIPAHAAGWENATGPHPTTVVASAGPGGRYYIQRPATLRGSVHPIVVLCVGTGAHPRNYQALLAELASHGVVVIADVDSCQEDGTKAAAAMDWLLGQNETSGSEYFGKLISSRVLVIGHSSGANGAIAASVNNPKITSLLLFAPALSSARPAGITVPTFYISGSLDTTVHPELVKAAYRDTKANAWYAEREQQRHIGFAANPSIALFTRAWVYTQLFGDVGTARTCFYGPDWTLGKATGWKETLRNHSAP